MALLLVVVPPQLVQVLCKLQEQVQGYGLLGYAVFIALLYILRSSSWQEAVSDAYLLHLMTMYQVLQPSPLLLLVFLLWLNVVTSCRTALQVLQ